MLKRLTDHQATILRRLCGGATLADIAAEDGTNVRAVAVQRTQILARFAPGTTIKELCQAAAEEAAPARARGNRSRS